MATSPGDGVDPLPRGSPAGAGNGSRPGAGEPGIPPPRLYLRRYLPLALLLGLAVHLLLPQLAPLEHSLAIARSLPPLLIGLALAAQAASYLGNGYLIHRTVALFGEALSVGRGVVITLGAAAVGLVAGGTLGNSAAIMRWARASGVSREAAVLAGWVPTVLNPALEVVLGLLGLLYLLLLHRLSPLLLGAVASGLLGLGGLLLLAAWALYRPERARGWVEATARRIARLRRRSYDAAGTRRSLDRLADAGRLLRQGGWSGPALGSALNVGFDMLTLYLIFLAAGHAVSPGVLFAGYGIPLMLGKLSLLPGGLGVVEGSMAALYEALGVPGPVTVVVVLLYRLLSFWLPLLIGVPAVVYLQQTAFANADHTRDARRGAPRAPGC